MFEKYGHAQTMFPYFEPDINKTFVLELGGKLYGSKSFRSQHKRNRIE